MTVTERMERLLSEREGMATVKQAEQHLQAVQATVGAILKLMHDKGFKNNLDTLEEIDSKLRDIAKLFAKF